MKAVILAGGFGTRISEETHLKPKPMVEIGGKPILWHIMKLYHANGISDFVICLGYKGYVIKEYFSNYYLHMSDVTFDMISNDISYHSNHCEPWKVTLIDTGQNTMTGGRLKRIQNYIDDEIFCFTYGDGVSDVDINAVIRFHKEHGKLATMTAVQMPGRFGALVVEDTLVKNFKEKPKGDGAWINGGFFVLSSDIFNYIEGDMTVWEKEPLENLSKEGELAVYKYRGFWQAMDTLRDKNQLEDYWGNNNAPWKVW